MAGSRPQKDCPSSSSSSSSYSDDEEAPGSARATPAPALDQELNPQASNKSSCAAPAPVHSQELAPQSSNRAPQGVGKPSLDSAAARAAAPRSGVPSTGLGSQSVSPEPLSGIKTSQWRMRTDKWKGMVKDRCYVPMDRMSTLSSSSFGDRDAVVIAVLYEKSLPKSSANGNRFATWHLTDLVFPRPHQLCLFLHGSACEMWGAEQDAPVPHGAVVALLNPVQLPNNNRGSAAASDTDGRSSAKVSYDTQVVILGVCPSLGYCCATKKDGMKCSMPCDRDRGLQVCYFHNLQKHAQQIKQWSGAKASAGSAPGQGPQRALSDGVAVFEKKLPPKNSPAAQAQGVRPQWGSTAPKAGSLHRSSHTSVNKGDLAVAQLLAGPPPSRRQVGAATSRSVTTPSRSTPSSIATPMNASSSRNSTLAKEQSDMPSTASAGALVPAATQKSSSVDPIAGSIALHESSELSRRRTDSAAEVNAAAVERLRSKLGQDRYIPIPLGQALHEGTAVMARKRNPCLALATTKRAKKARLDPTLGATQVLVDPRKDSIRTQKSRHASLVDQERVATRHRQLAEFESQDAASEQMESVMSVNVAAWRCQECRITFDSSRKRSDCLAQSHTLTTVSAVKTKWECIVCKTFAQVFDRDLPESCPCCGGKGWRQLPLRGKARTAPMERELFLPRGEELPYLNSVNIPGLARDSQVREKDDQYAGLNHNAAG